MGMGMDIWMSARMGLGDKNLDAVCHLDLLKAGVVGASDNEHKLRIAMVRLDRAD